MLSSTLDQAPPVPPALLPLAGAWLAVGGDVQRAPVYFRPCAWLLSGPLALSLAGRGFCCLFIVPRFLLQLSRKENKAQSHTLQLGRDEQPHIGSLKSATGGAFTPRELARAAHQGFPPWTAGW